MCNATWGRGSEGGKVSGGYRETDAALKLEARGLLVRVSHSRDTQTWRGYSIHTSDFVFTAPTAQVSA